MRIPVFLQYLALVLSWASLCHAANFRVYKETVSQYNTCDFNDSTTFVSLINPDLETIVFTFGYNITPSNPETIDILSALISRDSYNVILVDWTEEASVNYLGSIFSYLLENIANAKEVGCQVGQALADAATQGLDGTKIHLIGHSLGAHLMGEAGLCAKEAGLNIPRITGLDPAGPVFDEHLAQRLDSTCAQFVDIIHTNPGNLGTVKASGHVDIYPNHAYKINYQPGCPVGIYPTLSINNGCSHIRAMQLFREGILYPENLPALGADNYLTWLSLDGVGDDITYIGLKTNLQARGKYYLTTNAESLFGKKTEGLKP